MIILPNRQRGAATLVVAMILLFTTSIAVFYLNRGLIFEQKSSANQVRSVTALEAAEAGIEWATGMLNRPNDIRADCTFDPTTNISFRRKYVQINYLTTSAITIATGVNPGCYINGTTTTCNCPNAGGGVAVLTPASALPGFTVAFSRVDASTVEIISTGCNAIAGSACTSATAANADATATVKVILKLRPMLRAAPATPLTCGNNCSVGGSFNLVNTDIGTNGISVNAGGNVTFAPGTSVTTIPGLPPANSQITSDSTLGALATADATCSNDSIFNAYFGSTLEEYAAAPMTKSISCSSANDCSTKVNAAYNAGWRSFYFPDGFAANNSLGLPSLGTQTDPVTIVTPGNIDINGNLDIYGVVFSNDSTFDDGGTGSANIHGALVSCKDFASNGNGSITYDAEALKNLQMGSALMVRVPGSWRDF